MDSEKLKQLLESVKSGQTDINDALEKLKRLPFEDVGFARIDHHRNLRCGFPEVIYCPNKTTQQIVEIFIKLADTGSNVLATRAEQGVYEALKQKYQHKALRYEPQAKAIVLQQNQITPTDGFIAIAAAGTSDLPVAYEAKVTAEIMGQHAMFIADVGVAGIHRILPHLEQLQNANVVIAIAGMEGALPSVIGGMVDSPVIAVPTSIGYGTSFAGLSALLTMLNSCASGVTVVNIDNGFGAAYTASLINRKIELTAKDK